MYLQASAGGIRFSYQKTRWAAVLGAVVLLCLIGVHTYAFSLRLPLFSDDVLFARWLNARSLGDIWTSAHGYSYYRPLSLTLWKVLALLQHRHDPLALHTLVLVLHLLNSVLVLALVAKTNAARKDHLVLGFFTATLFLLFPFSYQVVPWVSALMYPLSTALILGSLVLARWAPASRVHRIASIILALLAPLAHETGMLVAPLLFLLLVTEDEPLPFGQALRRTLPYWLCAALGMAVWLAVPKGSSQTSILDWSARWENAVYLAQGLIFPLAPLARRALSLNLDNLSATALLAGTALVLWTVSLIWAGRGKLVIRAIGWFAVALLPAWALLRAEYVRTSPHLFYQAAVGAALLWAIPVDLRPTGHLLSVAMRALAVLCVLWATASGYRFIRARVPLYEQVRLAVEQLVAARPAEPGPILLVNYPQWLAPQRNTFPIGSEGVVLVPPVATGLSDLLWTHTGEERSVEGVVFMELLNKTPWRFIFPSAGQLVDSDSLQSALRQTRHVLVTSYAQPDIAVYDAGGLVAEEQAPSAAYLASYADKLLLLSASQKGEGQTLHITLYWQCVAPVLQETSAFVHLYDSVGKLVAQADGYPLLDTARIVSWRPGDTWRDVRFLSLPTDKAAGHYRLKVGLYPTAGGSRLSARSPAGERFADDAVPIATLTLPF